MPLYELSNVDSVERQEEGLFQFDGKFGEGPPEDCPFFVEFYSPTIVALHLDPFTQSYRPNPYTEFSVDPPADLDVALTETDDTIELRTHAVVVTVETESGVVTARRPSGETLFHTDPDVTDIKNNVGVRNFGFSTEEVNRHPERVTDCHAALSIAPNENVYGGGEQKGDPNKRGQVMTAWVTQAGGSASRSTYKSAPFFVSDEGYGIYVDTTARTEFDFGCTVPGATGVTVKGDTLSLVLFAGESMKDVLQEYTAATGRPPRLPKWTYGLWTSRNTYESQEEALKVASEYRDREIPCDVLHLDPAWLKRDGEEPLQWDTDQFPDPEGLIDDLHESGFKLCLWEKPYVQLGTEAFEYAHERGYLATDGTEKPYVFWDYGSGQGIVDFTDSDACEWWTGLHVDLLEMGVDVIKADFGEYLPLGTVMSDRTAARITRNRYPQLYQQSIREAFDRTGVSPVFWTRAGWTGGQKYPIHWGGDPYSTYEGFRTSVEMALSISMSGYSFWSCDSGGYNAEPSPHLYSRWTQWSLLGNSHTRLHGEMPREPWEYGETAEQAVTNVLKERYRLVPYIYSYGNYAADTGIPLMRPMVLEHEDDFAAKNLGTQHYLGPNLLVAPVLDEEDAVEVYLPEGTWYDYWTDETYRGPTTIRHKEYPIERIPVYVRDGAIIPKQQPVAHLDEDAYEEVTLHVYADGEADTLLTNPVTEDQEEIEIAVGEGTVTVTGTSSLSDQQIVAVELHAHPDGRIEIPPSKRDQSHVALNR